MHFLSILAPLLAATAFAAPGHNNQRAEQDINAHHGDFVNYQANLNGNVVTAEDLSHFSELAKAFDYAATARGCSIWTCGAFLLKVPCIVSALGDLEWTAVAQCGASFSDLCDCATCVPGLGDALEKNKVC